MTGPADAAPPRQSPAGRLRRALPLVVLAVLGIVGVATSRSPDSTLPLDPDGTGPLGTKALRMILEEVGADVEILTGAPDEPLDTVLVLVDNFDETAVDGLSRHVSAGGVLVVTDPGGPLTPRLRPAGRTGSGFGDLPLARRCNLPALRDAAQIRVGSEPVFRVPARATGCYRDGNLAWLVARPLGSGTVVSTGGAGWLTNRGIRSADNAVLAGALLAPRPGTKVGIVRPGLVPAGGDGSPPTSISDLIPMSVKLALAQLFVAFCLIVLWRGRRLGKPLGEAQPVRLAGSELVIAVGNLLQRTGARSHAATLLRADLRGALSRRLSTVESDASVLADAVAARSGVEHTRVMDALAGPDPGSDAELVLLAQRAETIRHAVLAPPESGDHLVDNE
ncbi:MAG: hypothetical protein GEU74_01990 [Nitriliruptorales bacterium]|nr:hypothetical protein [Nitriliruptorales bacterium]